MKKGRWTGWEINRCAYCNRFKPWKELFLNFVPDSAFSSEDESYRICHDCRRKRGAVAEVKEG